MLQEFTSLWKTHAMFDDWEVTKTEAEVNYDKLDESDIFFKERKFVLDLVRYYYNKKHQDCL